MSSDRELGFKQTNIYTELTSLNFLSRLSNFLASSGNCELMSPPMNMLSRYIHFLCTSNNTCARYIYFFFSSENVFWIGLHVMGDELTDLDGLTDKGQIFFPLLYGAMERSNETTARHAL